MCSRVQETTFIENFCPRMQIAHFRPFDTREWFFFYGKYEIFPPERTSQPRVTSLKWENKYGSEIGLLLTVDLF